MEECYFCKKKYNVKQQKEAGVVFCPNDTGRIACKECWDRFSGQLKELLKYLKVEDIVLGYCFEGVTMSCKHKQYFKIDVSFRTKGRIVGANKIVDCESQICMCRRCGVLFVPVELREIPDLNSITELEKKDE